MSDREKIIAKIKKCLALSASANEHEADAALRQARRLMEIYGVSDLDIEAAEAAERRAKAGAQKRPANWETALACRVGDAFGCRVIFRSERHIGQWTFIGCGAAPEVSQYAFEVLLRQAKRARAEHIVSRLKRCKTATKTMRADLFCEGWVSAVTKTIKEFALDDRQAQAISAYVSTHYPALSALASRDRNEGRRLSGREYDDVAAGYTLGRSAELNRGVGGVAAPLALE